MATSLWLAKAVPPDVSGAATDNYIMFYMQLSTYLFIYLFVNQYIYLFIELRGC